MRGVQRAAQSSSAADVVGDPRAWVGGFRRKGFRASVSSLKDLGLQACCM